MTTGWRGQGTRIEYALMASGATDADFRLLEECRISNDQDRSEELDASNHDTAGRFRGYVSGMRDVVWNIGGNWLPQRQSHQDLLMMYANGTRYQWRINYPQLTPPMRWAFTATLTQFSRTYDATTITAWTGTLRPAIAPVLTTVGTADVMPYLLSVPSTADLPTGTWALSLIGGVLSLHFNASNTIVSLALGTPEGTGLVATSAPTSGPRSGTAWRVYLLSVPTTAGLPDGQWALSLIAGTATLHLNQGSMLRSLGLGLPGGTSSSGSGASALPYWLSAPLASDLLDGYWMLALIGGQASIYVNVAGTLRVLTIGIPG